MSSVTTEQLQEIYRLAYKWHDRSFEAGQSGFATEDVQAMTASMIALIDAFKVLDAGFSAVRAKHHKLWIHSDPGATTVWATQPDLSWVITEGFRRVRIPGVADSSAGQVVVLVGVENGLHEVYTNHDGRLHDADVTSELEVIDEAIRALQTVRAGIGRAETVTAGVTR